MMTPIQAETLSDLIGSIYDCALDPGRWPATLTELRLALGFKNAAMNLQAMPSGKMLVNVASGIESPWLERMPQYGAEVLEQWGGAEAIASYPLDEPAVLSRDGRRSDWEDNRYYVEWGKPQGIIDVMAIGLARDAGMIGSIGMGRHVSAGPIGARETDVARLLIPHFQRAVAISKVLDLKTVTASSFAAALDTVAAAVLLVAADLRIVHANKAGEDMLIARDAIVSERGTLVIRSPAANAALAVAVRQAAEAEATIGRRGFGIPAQRKNGEPSVLHVLPLRHGNLRHFRGPVRVAGFSSQRCPLGAFRPHPGRGPRLVADRLRQNAAGDGQRAGRGRQHGQDAPAAALHQDRHG